MTMHYAKVTQSSNKAHKEEISRACRGRDEAMMKEEMGKMKEKKMKTMYLQNLEMKEYMKKGTLYEARKTWT